jgi:hypothetical protein
VSEPAGALVAEQDADPAERDALQRLVLPTEKCTVPLGVPPFPVTEAAYVTGLPVSTDDGVAVAATEVAAVATEMESGAIAVWSLASVTSTVKAELPGTVGVPLMVPVELSSVRPAGKVPDCTDQVYGVVPPLAVMGAKRNRKCHPGAMWC